MFPFRKARCFPLNPTLELAVVDDLSRDRARLTALLTAYAQKQGLSWQITGFSSGEAFLAALTPGRFAVIFLDIIMGGMDGLETARRLRERDPDVPLVFVTTERGYALQGYEWDAAGFLVKEDAHMEQSFLRLMNRLQRRQLPPLRLELAGGSISLPLQDLCYAEVRDHTLVLHTRDRQIPGVRMTLEELRLSLPPDDRFVECHRGILVNLDAITHLDGPVITLSSGEILPVSRRRRASLEQAYAARHIARLREEL